MTVFQTWKLLNQFQKWRATRASMDGVGSMLVWVVWVACWRGKSGIVGVGGMGDVLACVAGQHVQREQGGWCVCVNGVLVDMGDMLLLLLLLLLKYYLEGKNIECLILKQK